MQSDDRKAPVWAGNAALRALGLVDWTATALGDPNGWPAPLRMAAGMVLNSPHPMCLAWGEREVLLHNEALGALLGSRVQGAQGQPFGGLWSDLQSALQPAMKSAWAGQALRCGDVPVVVSRHGRIESACFDFSWSPVHGEAGDVDGLLCAVVETTARMQAERALSHAQARAGNVLQGMDEAFMLLDADFRIEQINGAVALMDGRPASEIVGRTHWDVWPLSIGTELERGYRHAMAHRQHVVMEQRVPPRGVGKNALPGLRLEIRVHPIENGLAVFTRDVSPRKRAEERQRALLELGDRVRDLDDPRAILSTAAEIGGRALRVSRAGYAVVDTGGEWAVVETDWTRAEVPSVAGRHWLSSFGPTFLDNLRHGETIAVSDVSADERTSASIDSFGKIGVRALLNIPLIERGRLSAILFLHEQEPRDWLEEDIALWTEIGQRAWAAADRARAKAALRALNETLHASETRFRQLAELGPSLIWLGHRDGSLSYVNDRWIEYSGQSRDEALPWGWAAVVHADDIDALRAAWADARARAGIYQTEARLRRRDGQYRWYLIRATPLLDDGQEHDGQAITWLGANTDIHEHKTAEKATAETLRRTEDALRQSQKMEAVGQLTGGIAHDFNNLLQGITGSLDLVKKRLLQGRTGEIDRYVTSAMTSASRAAALTHRLLAFSRRQPLDPKPVKMNQLVASMEDLLRRTTGERIAIELALAGGLWTTLCDPNQLESALLNLVINARDAMAGGGTLTIATSNSQLDSAHLAHQGDAMPGSYVCLSVHDTGCGMPPDVVQRAFEPFFTTKPTGQGTGLGLSMVYGFARQSEGFTKIDSEVGRGTTVQLYLPRHRGDDDGEEADAASQPPPASGSDEVVLVVEDEAVVRALIVDVLIEMGYEVLEAADGPSGLAVLQSGRRIDLLLSDIGLPGLNGRQLADAARATRPDLKVLFMTGYAENAAVASGFLDHRMALITKPFALEALVARIQAFMLE